MRHDHEIELPEVDACGFDVLREHIRVVARVEQNAPPADFDERGKAPVLLHGRDLAERVVQDSDLLRRCHTTVAAAAIV
jgi:hypothetical protein